MLKKRTFPWLLLYNFFIIYYYKYCVIVYIYYHVLSLYFVLCRSKDEELDLVDVDKFYAEAPTEISRPVCNS